jgi:hypothetical protein
MYLFFFDGNFAAEALDADIAAITTAEVTFRNIRCPIAILFC